MFKTKLVGYKLPGQITTPCARRAIGTSSGQLSSSTAEARISIASLPTFAIDADDEDDVSFSALVETWRRMPLLEVSTFSRCSPERGISWTIHLWWMFSIAEESAVIPQQYLFAARFGSSGGNRKFEPNFANRPREPS